MALEEVRKRLSIETASSGLEKTASDINKVADAEARLAVESQKTERAQLSMEGAFAKLERRYVDGVRQQQELARVQQQVNSAVAQNPALQERANAVMAGATARLNQVHAATQSVAQSSGLARHELINLSRQAQDVGVSLASGQSPMTVLIQQGSQIADVFASSRGSVGGFFSQAIGWAGRFVTSTAGVVTGVGAIAAAGLYAATSWTSGQQEIEKALIGIGKRSGATASDINKVADESAKANRLSVAESRTAALEFVKTGNIYAENLGGLVGLVKGHAVAIGESSEEAAKQLAKIFGGDIVEGADKLSATYGTISGATRQYIVELDILGRRQEAIAVLAKNVAPEIRKAADVTGFWAKSWDIGTNAASDFFSTVGKGLSNLTGVGQSRQDRLANAQGALKIGEAGLSEQRELAGVIGPQFVPGLKQAEQAVEKLREEVARLNKEVAEGGAATDQSRLLKIGQDADTAVRALVPFIEQLEKVAKAQELIKRAQGTPGAQQGLAGSNAEAARAAELMSTHIKNTREETDRANKVAQELMKTYGTSSREIAMMRAGLADQLVVASAVGGQARLAAQEQATYNDLIRKGAKEQDAAGVAAAQRAVAQAQINTQAKEQLFSLQNQFAVASAVTGAERMRAQQQATYNQLVHDGVDPAIATQVAAQEHANAQAQVNAQAKNTLLTMQDQRAVSAAITGDEKISAQAQATYNQLRRQGVDASIASAIAAEQEAQARAAVSAQVIAQSYALDQQTDLIFARLNGTEATVKAEQAYTNAIRAGADAYAAAGAAEAVLNNERAKAYVKAVERERAANDAIENQIYNQQKQIELLAVEGGWLEKSVRSAHAYNDAIRAGASAGWARAAAAQSVALWEAQIEKQRRDAQQNVQLTTTMGTKTDGGVVGNQAGITTDKFNARIKEFTGFNPTPGFYEDYINRFILDNRGGGMGGGTMDAINKLFEGPIWGGVQYGNNQLDMGKINTLGRLTELLPDAEKIGVIEREINELRSAPGSLARDELIKSLTDKLTQLKEATEGNTEALNAQLDPLFTEGHDYINKLQIGYFKAASGLDMVARGPSTGDTIPFHAMVNGGERIQITPPGQWSAKAANSNVSNDNSRRVTQNITQNITMMGGGVSRLTARQQAQGFIAAASRAVG